MESVKEREERIRKFWERKRIFEKSVEARRGGKTFVFYEGPPTANASPGLHHAYARALKDLFPRYKTMRGSYSLRRAGWDSHGLPVELQVEKKLGLRDKRAIETFGIAHFNKLCREDVFSYKADWEEMTRRLGFWLDFKDAYITLDSDYIESVWWALAEIYKLGLIYEDFKVVPYCPRCGTPLSDHEVALGYKDTDDPSIYVKFKLLDTSGIELPFPGTIPKPPLPTYLLAWTTTPWTLPANVALAVEEDADYVSVAKNNEVLIGAFDAPEFWRVVGVEKPKRTPTGLRLSEAVSARFSGYKLIGKRYEGLFSSTKVENNKEKIYRIVPADFVSLDEGTGIVHIAPAFGAEDLDLAKRERLPVIENVGPDGRFTTGPWQGRFVKDADPEIIDNLKRRKLLWKSERITHSYPFCWRCETPLLYFARHSWFIKTTAVRDKLIENNQKTAWHPSYFKEGRFGNWLDQNVDWAISRDRYWGTPLPFWRCSDGHLTVIGSRAHLRKRARGAKIPKDLHRPDIDEVEIECTQCHNVAHRIPEVLDVWFDSGAMPFAQWHYPFENKARFQEQFPADFIAEGQDQTRGWFYTLLAISTLLFRKPAYRHVISHGLLLDERGEKMSKSRGNAVEPSEVLDRFGADATRLYFYTRPLGESVRFSLQDVRELYRKFIVTLDNSVRFFELYHGQMEGKTSPAHGAVLDRWIHSRLATTAAVISQALERFDPTTASRALLSFLLDDFSNWYLRRSRARRDRAFFGHLREILLTFARLAAPFTPFIAEDVWQRLRGSAKKVSVHLEDWPKLRKPTAAQRRLEGAMATARLVATLGLAARNRAKIPVRQPLSRLEVRGARLEPPLREVVACELNVEDVKNVSRLSRGDGFIVEEREGLAIALNCRLTAALRDAGTQRNIIRHIQSLRKKAGLHPSQAIRLFAQSGDPRLEAFIKAHARDIVKATNLAELVIGRGRGERLEGHVNGATVTLSLE